MQLQPLLNYKILSTLALLICLSLFLMNTQKNVSEGLNANCQFVEKASLHFIDIHIN